MIEIFDRQERVGVDVERLGRFAERVYGKVMGLAGTEEGDVSADVLGALSGVEVTIVSDEVIAEVHERFMDIAGPTDVITFAHGEIVISADTAAVQAREQGTGSEEEVALYLVHGLLHLRGYDDRSEAAAAEMRACQEAILGEFWEVSGA
ncbi:MAG: rRNA maturation RNase YbeY [Verrucomicrobiota bacterium]